MVRFGQLRTGKDVEGNDHGLTVVVSRNFSRGIEEINGRTLSTAGVPAEDRTRHLPNKVRSTTGTKKDIL
jgi:hypothetical protein